MEEWPRIEEAILAGTPFRSISVAYDGAKQDFATRSGLIQKEQLFSPEQLTEIFRCCADSVDENFFELTDTQEEMIRGIQQQIRVCVPDLDERVRQQEEALERASQEQTM